MQQSYSKIRTLLHQVSRLSTNAIKASSDATRLQRIRNIGIIAHIDAGKTTISERMLYYTHRIAAMGEVHHGDTVMDNLEQERARGITIQSACTRLAWNDCSINLIDTPGHVDFTIEVERCLRVLDGAVAVFDGASGVEAQSETVWRQAQHYGVPRLAFVNKMDRIGSSVKKTTEQMCSRLDAYPLILHVPLGEAQNFRGFIDVTDMTCCEWIGTNDEGSDGSQVLRIPLANMIISDSVRNAALQAREHLVERVAEKDDDFMLYWLDEHNSNTSKVEEQVLRSAIRRLTIANKAVPVLCGSALKNTGIQALLDAVCDFLPSPNDVPVIHACAIETRILKNKNLAKDYLMISNTIARANNANKDSISSIKNDRIVELSNGDVESPLCVFAFKVVADAQRGPITYCRVMTGSLHCKDLLINTTNKMINERITRLLVADAALHGAENEIDHCDAGNIIALVGLKNTRTGDTLVSSKRVNTNANATKINKLKVSDDMLQHKLNDMIYLPGIQIPTPVFFCAVEVESQIHNEKLNKALTMMQLEDPSLTVKVDEETGQTLLQGMGELHLEIVQQRLMDDFKVPCQFGTMQVAYRETITNQCSKSFAMIDNAVIDITMDGDTTKNDASILVGLDMKPAQEHGGLVVKVASTVSCKTKYEDDGEEHNNQAKLSDTMMSSLLEGLNNGLQRGILLGYPCTDIEITVTSLFINANATPSLSHSLGQNVVGMLLRECEAAVLEPIMSLDLRVDNAYVGDVLQDLAARRRAVIKEVGNTSKEMDATMVTDLSADGKPLLYSCVQAEVPLVALIGYSNILRSKTQGNANYSFQFQCFRRVPMDMQKKLLNL